MTGWEYLGTGMKFPPQIDRASGRFMVSSGEESVRESVYSILMTQRGERWLHPGFGSRLMSYTFMDTSATRLGMMARDLRQTLLDQEPRIADVLIRVEERPEKGCLLISIDYTLAESQAQGNMVVPFLFL